MMRSITLETVEVSDIGRKFEAFNGLPFFNVGTIFAVFKILGSKTTTIMSSKSNANGPEST